MPSPKSWLPLAAAPLLLLAGCATVPTDRGYGDVRQLVSARGGPELPAPDAESGQRVAELLAEPLTSERAVAVALLRNPALRTAYARLGIAQSEVLEASRLSNPTLDFAALFPGSGQARLDYGLTQNFTDLLFLSARSRLARHELERAKQSIGSRIQNLAADVAAAHCKLVGAQQVAQMREVIARAGDASSELAQRFHQAGNINELEWKREQAAGTQASLEAEAAAAEVLNVRTELNRLMGLRAAERDWRVLAQLPLPVAEEDSVEDLRKLAQQHRLDLAAKRTEAETLVGVRDLARKLRWLPLLDVGVKGERDDDGTHLIGPSVSLQLPIFNQGQGSLARAEAMLERSWAELAGLAADVGNDVTSAYDRMLAARKRVQRLRSELMPQREAVVERTQELLNYMIVGQFELLLAKQEEYDTYESYLKALRDYWLARVELARAVGAKLPSDARIGPPSAGAIELPAQPPASQQGGHGGHSMKGMDMDEMKDMPGMEHTDHSGHASEPPKQKPDANQHH